MGYLPLATLKNHLARDIGEVVDSFEKRGLKVKVFQMDDCCIKSGAIYIYDPSALQNILNAASHVLKKNEWPVVAESFVAKVAEFWVEQTHPVHPVIRRAFGDS